MTRRVVVTGVSAVSPCGNTMDRTWASLIEGWSGIAPLELIDTTDLKTTIGGERTDFDPTPWSSKTDLRHHGRYTHLAVAASTMAAEAAGLETADDGDCGGTFIGVALGGLPEIVDSQATLDGRGLRRVSPFSTRRAGESRRGASSSIASGSRSTLATRVSASGRCASVSAKSGRTRRARSTRSATASSGSRGPTGSVWCGVPNPERRDVVTSRPGGTSRIDVVLGAAAGRVKAAGILRCLSVTDAAEKLLDDAMALPSEDRARVAAALIASLDEGEDADAEASWAAVIERRADRVLSGGSKGQPWKRVRERLLGRLERG